MTNRGPLSTSVKVEGLAELDKKLREFGPTLAAKGMKFAVSRGARVIRDDARANAPMKTGVLKRSLYIKWNRQESSPWVVTYIVGARRGKKARKVGKDAWYWPFLEFGTVHIKARRFIQNAFQSRQGQAIDAIKDGLAKKIVEYAEKKP